MLWALDVTDKDGKKFTKTVMYTYDLLGRITKETKTGGGDISYTYDSNNNRKEMSQYPSGMPTGDYNKWLENKNKKVDKYLTP